MEAGGGSAGPVQLEDTADVAVDTDAFVDRKKERVDGLVHSKLPVGLRPGFNALYHFGQPVPVEQAPVEPVKVAAEENQK
jgi:hypothetical protein